MLVVGSLNVDLTFYVDHFPCPGETAVGSGFKKTFGGKGANQGARAAQAGKVTKWSQALFRHSLFLLGLPPNICRCKHSLFLSQPRCPQFSTKEHQQ